MKARRVGDTYLSDATGGDLIGLKLLFQELRVAVTERTSWTGNMTTVSDNTNYHPPA